MTDEFDALDDQIENSSPSSSGSSSGDYVERPWVNITPRIAIAGTIRDLGSTCDVQAEQNIRGANGYGGDVILTLEDPEVLLGDAFEAEGRSAANETVRTNEDSRESTDYRIVDFDDGVIDEKVEKVDGEYEEVGITYYDKPFYAERREDFRSDETVEVFVSSHAGQLVFQALHAGPPFANYPSDAEGYADHNGGAVEFPPAYGDEDYTPEDDGYPRIASQGELHPDLDGERVILYMKWGSENQGNRKHIGHVLWDRDEDSLTEMTNLVTEDPLDDATELAEDTYTFLVWDDPEGVETDSPSDGDGGGAGGSDAADESDGGSFDGPERGSGSGSPKDSSGESFDALDDQIDDTATDTGPTSYADLGTNEQAFVDQVVAKADDAGVDPNDLLDGEFADAWAEESSLEGTTDGATALQIARTRSNAAKA